MKKLILLVVLLMLVACTSTPVNKTGINTNFGADFVGGKVIPRYNFDLDNSIEF